MEDAQMLCASDSTSGLVEEARQTQPSKDAEAGPSDELKQTNEMKRTISDEPDLEVVTKKAKLTTESSSVFSTLDNEKPFEVSSANASQLNERQRNGVNGDSQPKQGTSTKDMPLISESMNDSTDSRFADAEEPVAEETVAETEDSAEDVAEAADIDDLIIEKSEAENADQGERLETVPSSNEEDLAGAVAEAVDTEEPVTDKSDTEKADQGEGLETIPSSDEEDPAGAVAEAAKTEEPVTEKPDTEKPETEIPLEIVSKYLKLEPLPSNSSNLKSLTKAEKQEIEEYLQIEKDGGWREDWIGNLAFADKDIPNPDAKSREKGKKPLFRWAEKSKVGLKLLNNLIRFVYGLEETPEQAKKVLASADPLSAHSIQDAVRRVSYDPVVLQEDGWTTTKSSSSIGSSGGPYRIGEMVFWQGYTGVVIAYIHDDHLGDLWKAMWLEEFDTFDLEAEELDEAKKKYERRKKLKEQKMVSSPTKQSNTDVQGTRRSGRNLSAEFSVKGIEHGIVLAVSYSRGSRPGVFWPARVVHFSEMKSSQFKRGSQKQKIEVVFLAPYWNAAPNTSRSGKESYSETLSRHGNSIFNSGPLFEVETIDASEESIQEYPYDGSKGLDIDQLRTSFKFVGLPKAAFSRFVDSHRLALGLKNYSQKVMKSTSGIDELHLTSASLFEAHPIAAKTCDFPAAVLHLPFEHILSELPDIDSDDPDPYYDDLKTNEEPVVQLGAILDSMKPPNCWGLGKGEGKSDTESPQRISHPNSFASPPIPLKLETVGGEISPVTLDRFTTGLSALNSLLSETDDESSMSALLLKNLNQLLSKVPSDSSEVKFLSTEVKRSRCNALVKLWIVVKTHGEELISSFKQNQSSPYLIDWRKLCERVYKYITIAFSSKGIGNSVSWILTDSLCNEHRTSNGCFERPVRLPAAIKAAKEVGAGKSDKIKLMPSVKERYIEMAETQVIRRAHSKAYIQRIKKRCLSVSDKRDVVPLTEDSDGNGGEDTKGSRGSWKAAIAGVGAAVQAVDMIMNGECVNVFAATRPPGHHAGRELHAMKAVSNGFCLLNPAACAALYATSPISEGGPGLRRVCIIDIDVHHGNGTQDILCSTYDPRFFYVSMHAGGPDVNGLEPGTAEEELAHHLGRNPKKGIFPGRCGDSSPHDGVLNIPLGSKVTSHALGTALVTKVTPAVEKFSPDLIIISTGFDAHKNDPLGLGGLSAEDFGTLTEVICKLAHKSCSGRVLSILEGGYGVPCCTPQSNLFDPDEAMKNAMVGGDRQEAPGNSMPNGESGANGVAKSDSAQNITILDLGKDRPSDMIDEVPYLLQRRLEKCHQEGFMQCVREHIQALAKSNTRN